MAAPTRRPEADLDRFDRTERVLHWVDAGLFLVLVVTGAVLYLSPLQALIGRRALVEDVHLAAGLALPVPLLLSLPGRGGAALREDLRRLNRWSGDDRRWLRATLAERGRRAAQRRELVVGKFNAGQKLNTAFTGGVILVMLMTGVVMYWYHPWPLSWRTGATDTHDWVAAAVVVVIAGHVRLALRDPDALRSMWTGRIPRRWADRHAPGWVHELRGPPPAAGPPS